MLRTMFFLALAGTSIASPIGQGPARREPAELRARDGNYPTYFPGFDNSNNGWYYGQNGYYDNNGNYNNYISTGNSGNVNGGDVTQNVGPTGTLTNTGAPMGGNGGDTSSGNAYGAGYSGYSSGNAGSANGGDVRNSGGTITNTAGGSSGGNGGTSRSGDAGPNASPNNGGTIPPPVI